MKSVSTAAVPPGGTFTYSLLVSNQGPSDASDVVVTDTLVAGLTFVSSAEGCTVAASVVTCPTIAVTDAGDFRTVTFVVQLDAGYSGNGSDSPNTAHVSTTTTDAIPTNTSNTVFPPVGGALTDVPIEKTYSEHR